jgi:FkbM family methyltransferase
MRPKSARFKRLLAASRIVALDIGARGGFTEDLAPIGSAVEAIGFEPDNTECEALNAAAAHDTLGYRALRYVPTAVGRAAEERMLNLYRKRGCTSLLEGDAEFAKQFAREHFFILDGQIPVNVERLDDAAARFDFTNAQFMKIDIQGAELEAIQSAPKLVGDSLLAIRAEVEFAPLYKDQPLFADLDAELRGKGFMFIGFPEMHAWRRGTEAKPDRWIKGPAPMSAPQLIHGDAFYLRDPAGMSCDGPAECDRMISLALIAFAYGQIDLMADLMTRTPVSQRIRELAAFDPVDLLNELGRWHAGRHRHRMGKAALKQLRDYLRILWR